MQDSERFQDENLRIEDFEKEAWVHCISCNSRAVARFDPDRKKAKLICSSCGLFREISSLVKDDKGREFERIMPAQAWFGAELWYSHPFRGDVFFAYNPDHLDYLERYIQAKLREHKNRSYFTLLEKLPRFYHRAGNREGLLKIIEKLRNK